MRKRDVAILFALGGMIVAELLIIVFLLYFATLPFFIFLIVVWLKLISFFLIGFIAVFLVMTIIGKKPEELVATWINNLRESMRFLPTSVILTFLLIILCTILGALFVYLLKRVYALSSVKAFLAPLQHWIAIQLK